MLEAVIRDEQRLRHSEPYVSLILLETWFYYFVRECVEPVDMSVINKVRTSKRRPRLFWQNIRASLSMKQWRRLNGAESHRRQTSHASWGLNSGKVSFQPRIPTTRANSNTNLTLRFLPPLLHHIPNRQIIPRKCNINTIFVAWWQFGVGKPFQNWRRFTSGSWEIHIELRDLILKMSFLKK